MFYTFQEKLIFLPTQLPQDYQYSFDQPFEELFLDTPDGSRLNALHFVLENPKGLILYFHGNAGDLSRWGQIASTFTELGYEVIVMDYRGYGKSTGERSEELLYEDAQRFYDLAKEKHPEEKIIVYGRSLGTGIASHLVSNNKPKKLVLETPYYSLLEVAQGRFPFLPVNYMLKYRLPSHKYLESVSAPIRIFHGTEDRIVPYASGEKLFKSIQQQDKIMYTIPNGQHNDLDQFEIYQNGIKKELE
ncbi:alpha/beta hydrolase [Flagellimonas myxillae]|uniref:alpha/beta hydrolase n=1 Tax=Flagellimonas myxillae TaxID=2942214 RepID=UPI00201F52EF|nr:alpha/beta fold hydrolase [Muricauda myxillae]MCL6266005.1 lysophospholipase [Muricauda myxillae]